MKKSFILISVLIALIFVTLPNTSVLAAEVTENKPGYIGTFQAVGEKGKYTLPEVIIKRGHKLSDMLIVYQPEIMQDLTQCTVALGQNLVTGEVESQVLCIDVCGGRSQPGTVCSFE
jgi:hypothetical protein